MSGTSLARWLLRAFLFVVGGVILYRQVWVGPANALIVLIGLWLIGAPIAQLLDTLRRVAALKDEIMKEPEKGPDPKRKRRR